MVDSVKILGKRFDIVYVPASSEYLDCGLCTGKLQNTVNKIYVDEALNMQMGIEVILHEILHSLDLALCLNLNEEGVTRLSECLMCVLVDNPELFAS